MQRARGMSCRYCVWETLIHLVGTYCVSTNASENMYVPVEVIVNTRLATGHDACP